MKKLLASLAVISLVATTGSAVTACGTSNTSTSDQQNFDSIKSSFQTGVSGSDNLSTANTQQDGANYLQTWAQTNVNKDATVTLASQSQTKLSAANDQLVAGDNNLTITLTVGSINGTFTAKLTGIKDATDAQAAAAIKAKFETGINASTLNSDQTYTEGLNFLVAQAHTIKNTAQVVLTTPGDSTKPLVVGNNTIVVNITVGEVNETSVNALLTSVAQGPTIAILNSVSDLLTNGVVGTVLTDLNTLTDAVTGVLTNAAHTINSGVTVELTDSSTGANKLAINNNLLDVTIEYNGHSMDVQDAKITGVVGSQTLITNITNRLTTGIDGTVLDTTRTVGAALLLIQNSVKDLIGDVTATLNLQNSNIISNLLQKDTNMIPVVLNIDGLLTPININANVLHVSEQADNIIVNLIKTRLELGTMDATLTTTNTYADAVTKFQTIAHTINSDATVTLTNPSDATKPLVINANTINVTIAFKNATTTANAVITITNTISQDQLDANLIKSQFESGILAIPLTSLLNTQADGLLLLNVRAKLVNLYAVVTLVNPTDATKHLTSPNTIMNVLITVNTATATTANAKLTGIIL